MKIKRWIILTTVFVMLAGSIAASGCQTNNTASTNNMLTTSQDNTTDCTICNNCSVAGKSYNCNTSEGQSQYVQACTANCEYNGKTYDCTTLLGCASFWSTIGCEMCMQVCEGADDSGNN